LLVDEIENFIDQLINNWSLHKIRSWDGGPGEAYICDEMTLFLWDERYVSEDHHGNEREGRFGSMLSACCRAGFDVAVSPSAGVVGFTVGDLRTALGPRLPQWVTNWFEQALPSASADDTESVWL
jgi:hypothetical protein